MYCINIIIYTYNIQLIRSLYISIYCFSHNIALHNISIHQYMIYEINRVVFICLYYSNNKIIILQYGVCYCIIYVCMGVNNMKYIV